ncbi:MAG: DNA gyrase C-terminal beta-propeller domain-containing protein, partial [Sphingomonadales bacterium]
LVGETVDWGKENTYKLSELQVKAILDLRLHRLTALGRDEIGGELKELGVKIQEFLNILQSREKVYEILIEELTEVKDLFSTPRRTEIIEGFYGEMEDEDLIQREDMVVTVTHSGYIKRVPLNTYRAQRRGGKGRSGMQTKDEDAVTNVFVANTHTPILFFSDKGQVYKMKTWKLPLGSPQSKGKALINLLPLAQDEKIATILMLPEEEEDWKELHVMFATSKGKVRRNLLSDFSNVMANGKIAIRLDDDDTLVDVKICTEDDDVLLSAAGGKCIRFKTTAVRLFKGRTATGVRGIRVKKEDKVISMSILRGQNVSTEERDAYLKAANWKPEPNDPTLSAKRMT